MSNLSKIVLLLFCLPLSLFGQEDASLGWIKELAKEVQEETDLCERCTWIPPAISEVAFNNQIFYFLRYGCSTTESVARMYEPDGTFLGECKSNDDDFVCNPSDVDAFITYTFANRITVLWSCETGFDCAFALANDINREVPIFVDDTRCIEGIKTLEVSDKFVKYEWEGGGITGTTATLEITQGGHYGITVTDEMNCTFSGTIEIPSINELNVIIKGLAEKCPSTTTELISFGFQSYEWSTGSTDSLIQISAPGTYSITVTNSQDCSGSTSFLLQDFAPLAIEIEADKLKVSEGSPVKVSLTNAIDKSAILSYKWTGNSPIDCIDCEETIYFPRVDNELMVSVIDKNNCSYSVGFFMEVEALRQEIYAPNIFRLNSPTGDNRFTLHGGANIERIERLTIFDRWGNQIFTKKDFPHNQMSEGWNGRTKGSFAPQDVYIFQSVVLFINGEQKTISGDFLLLR